MKQLFYIAVMLVLGGQLISCKNEKKDTAETEKPAVQFVASETGSSMEWTAYKTSDKVPVKGTFKEVKIVSSNAGDDAAGALSDLGFEIPVNSIFTNDTIRDGKLQRFFFAVMENSMTLKGKFKVESGNSGKLEISMNGLSKTLPFDYEVDQDTIHVSATMDLNEWGAQAALESLNEACKVLHTGADGVSKTWNDVALNAKILTVQSGD
ncbi:MAG: YceI family protein [Lutimonas sp.]